MDGQTQTSQTDDVVQKPLVVGGVPQPENGQMVLINMEGLIKNHLSAADRLKDEIRKHKEMLDDILANDPTYQEHLEAAKDATKTKTATKAQILKQPQAADLDKKLKDLKIELKENQGSLSDYTVEYARLSGVNEIESENGEMLEIRMQAKLVKK